MMYNFASTQKFWEIYVYVYIYINKWHILKFATFFEQKNQPTTNGHSEDLVTALAFNDDAKRVWYLSSSASAMKKR